MMKIFFLFSSFAILTFLHAQQTISQKNFENYPYWISMMKDTATNYFETEKAFNTFWSVRPLPTEEEDILGNPENYKDGETFFDRLITTKKEKREQESEKYAFEYKAFKQWQIRVSPWVRPDGSITFPSQRLKIYNSEIQKRNN